MSLNSAGVRSEKDFNDFSIALLQFNEWRYQSTTLLASRLCTTQIYLRLQHSSPRTSSGGC